MDDLMDDERIERLARELGDEAVAERLVAARGEVVGRVPDQVTRAHLKVMLDEIHRTDDTTAVATTAGPRATPLHERRRARIVDAAVLTTRVAAVAIGLAVLTTGGLAAANALPVAAQTAVAELAERIGLDRLGVGLPAPPASPPDMVPTRTDDAPRGGERTAGRAGRATGPGRDGLSPGRSGDVPGRSDGTLDRGGDTNGGNDDPHGSGASGRTPGDDASGGSVPTDPPAGLPTPPRSDAGQSPAGDQQDSLPDTTPPPREQDPSETGAVPGSADDRAEDRAPAPKERHAEADAFEADRRDEQAPHVPEVPPASADRNRADGNATG